MSEFWIQTYSTNKYDFVENNPSDISLIDIANSLAQIPRFGGHLNRRVSVAQHSIIVGSALHSDEFSKDVALQGLMHDAHEAYMGDLTSPFIRYLESKFDCFNIEEVEIPIKHAITERFGIDIVNIPHAVERYDQAALRNEANSMFDRPIDNWTDRIEYKMDVDIRNELDVHEAKTIFVELFEHLGGEV